MKSIIYQHLLKTCLVFFSGHNPCYNSTYPRKKRSVAGGLFGSFKKTPQAILLCVVFKF